MVMPKASYLGIYIFVLAHVCPMCINMCLESAIIKIMPKPENVLFHKNKNILFDMRTDICLDMCIDICIGM